MNKHIQSITIVGGGSSGWMTAAAICKQLPNVKLTLVESPNIPIIGVGESTIGHINEFFSMLELKDEDWMKACNATYKTSIKFIDFRENPKEKPHTFHYPFGQFDLTDKPRGLMEWFIYKLYNKDLDNSDFAEFFHDAILMSDSNKMTKNEDMKLRGFVFDTDTAYHMDAGLLGIYLRDTICIPSGMTHILEDVASIHKNDSGEISNVITANGIVIESDLFIDCTGFKSMLLEQEMGVEFRSFGDTLMNDRAIATVIPYTDKQKEMENYTSCTAIDCGWVWNIPLWHRIGTGYVYSSKFASEDEALEQFKRHLNSNRMTCPNATRADDLQFRHIKIKHGVHDHAWEKNVVGIGLANGFIEPLESTGLMLTHECIMKLIATLQMRDGHVTQYDIDLFNFGFNDQIWGFKDFISQHYALSRRNDTPYWKHVSGGIHYARNMLDFEPTLRDSSQNLAIRIHRTYGFDHRMSGIVYIAAGMGYNPVNIPKVKHLNKVYNEAPDMHIKCRETWEEHKKQVVEHIKTLPTHYEYLRDYIYK